MPKIKAGDPLPRAVFHVTFSKSRKLWLAKIEGVGCVVDFGAVKSDLLSRLSDHCDKLKQFGFLAQILIHLENGDFQKEWTYGNDPKSSKG